MQVEIALWLRSSSPWPDLTAFREVEPDVSALDAALALMREHQETSVFKAAVRTPYGMERLYHLALPMAAPTSHVSALELVRSLWSFVEQEHFSPVDVGAAEALDLVLQGVIPSALPWLVLSVAADRRLFADHWNARRADVARDALLEAMECEAAGAPSLSVVR